ncbi:MAG: hypothetical protein D6682_07645 [Zetaproteobacteria bacterium]|nr:MAG: hypothetical protein D6682_07645 [Zetaproteobacteria bacterium]
MRRWSWMALAAALALGGCSFLAKPDAGKEKRGMVQGKQGGKVLERTASRMLTEFGDVPVPVELKRDDELSFVYEAPGVTMGVVTLSGYYTGASIARFFRTEMPRQQWQFLNAFSEGNRYMLNFLKANRSCVINIREDALSTRVTIKVGPTRGGG